MDSILFFSLFEISLLIYSVIHYTQSCPLRWCEVNSVIGFDRFVQEKLGGPTLSEYEKLQAELSDLQTKYTDLLAAHQEQCKEVWVDSQ